MIAAAQYCVILDRDKTINADPGYLNDPDKVALLPRAAEGIKLLNQFNIPIYVATNQSGVARGLIKEAELTAVNRRITDLLAAEGAQVGEFFICRHSDESNCDCRKPKSGLIRQIIEKYHVEPRKTYVVGDRARDLACAESFGIQGIHIGLDDGDEIMPGNFVFRARDLHETAQFILEAIFEQEVASKLYRSAAEYLQNTAFQRAGKKVIFTNGCFDLLHSGHVQLLAQARALGDHLVLGLNSDASVQKLKGPTRPVNNEVDRARILAQLPYIDAIVIFSEDTPVELMKLLQPDIQVKGGDYIKEELPEYPVMRAMGKEIVILPFRKGYSTTQILARSH